MKNLFRRKKDTSDTASVTSTAAAANSPGRSRLFGNNGGSSSSAQPSSLGPLATASSKALHYSGTLTEGLGDISSIDIFSGEGSVSAAGGDDSVRLRRFAEAALFRRREIADGSQEVRFSRQSLPALAALASFLVQTTPRRGVGEVDLWPEAIERLLGPAALQKGKGSAERLAYYKGCSYQDGLFTTDAEAVACIASMCMMARTVTVLGDSPSGSKINAANLKSQAGGNDAENGAGRRVLQKKVSSSSYLSFATSFATSSRRERRGGGEESERATAAARGVQGMDDTIPSPQASPTTADPTVSSNATAGMDGGALPPLQQQRQQQAEPLDVRLFANVDSLTLVDCRINVIQGSCPCLRLILLRSSIVAPPSSASMGLTAAAANSRQNDENGGRTDGSGGLHLLRSWASFPYVNYVDCSGPDSGGGHLSPEGVAWVADTLQTLKATDRTVGGDTFPLVRSAAGVESAPSPSPTRGTQNATDGTAENAPSSSSSLPATPVNESTVPSSSSAPTPLPPWLRLATLDLSDNNLTCIHGSIRNAKNLSKLILKNNKLTSLTPSLRFCEHLTHVDLQHNNLWSPTEISACLRNVTYLDVSYNKLVSVWELALLKNLAVLNIGFNRLNYWSDLAHIAESCLSMRSITFRGNPMCEPSRIFSGDVNKLGSALFRNAVGVGGGGGGAGVVGGGIALSAGKDGGAHLVEVNGMAREMDNKQAMALMNKYSHFFTEAAKGQSMDALAAERAAHYSHGAGSSDSHYYGDGDVAHFPSSPTAGASVDFLVGSSSRKNATSDSYPHMPGEDGMSVSGLTTLSRSQEPSSETLGGGKIRTVKIVKKVVKKKKKHADDAEAGGDLNATYSSVGMEGVLGGDEEVGEGGDSESETISTSVIDPDDHIDPVTGDKPDLAFLIGKYGPAKGLTRYNELSLQIVQKSRQEAKRRKIAEAEAAAAAALLFDPSGSLSIRMSRKSPDEEANTGSRSGTKGAAKQRPATIASLKGDAYHSAVDQGLHKFLTEEIQKKLGFSYKCFPVRSETVSNITSRAAAANPIDEASLMSGNKSLDWSTIQNSLLASHFENVTDEHAETNPLLLYTGKNIWQVGLGTGRYCTDANHVVEVWISDEKAPVPDKIADIPTRYDGRLLIKVEKFDYDGSVSFTVRQKFVESVSKTVNFPQPVLTSVHFCPWSHGKSDFLMEVTGVDIVTSLTSSGPLNAGGGVPYTGRSSAMALSKRTDSSDSLDHLAETTSGEPTTKIKMTLAQKREMIGTFSRPSQPQMLVGIVVPNGAVAAAVMKGIFAKFRDFRNPHYVLQRLDWPLMTHRAGNENAIRVPFHGNGLEQKEAVEVFRGLAVDADEGGNDRRENRGDPLAKVSSSSEDPLPPCEFREGLLASIRSVLTNSDAVEFAVHQRLGSMFRVHPEEISFHIRTLLIPPGSKASEIRIVGSSFANASICPVDDATPPHERDKEFSVFIVVLSTTFCVFEDFNYEGSAAKHSDDMFKPLVTYGMSELSFVAIGFGCQHIILNFGIGTDEIALYFRDVASTLRMVGFLREAASTSCSFIMLPWYRGVIECIDRDPETPEIVEDYFQCFMAQLSLMVVQTGGDGGGGGHLGGNGGGEGLLSKSSHQSRLYKKVSMSMLDFDASVGNSRRDASTADFGGVGGGTSSRSHAAFFANSSAAFGRDSYLPGRGNDTSAASGSSGGKSSVIKKSFFGGFGKKKQSTNGGGDNNNSTNNNSGNNLSSLRHHGGSSNRLDGPQTSTSGASHRRDPHAFNGYQWEGRSYPLRHIPPLTNTCWERVSIIFTKPSHRIYIVAEHTNRWAGDESSYADEVLRFPVLDVSFVEVCPRLSKVPLIAVLHADLGNGVIDKFLLVFQQDSTLYAFIASIQKFHASATAAFGLNKVSPTTATKVSAASVLFGNVSSSSAKDGGGGGGGIQGDGDQRSASTLLVTQIAVKASQHNSAITTEQVLRAILE